MKIKKIALDFRLYCYALFFFFCLPVLPQTAPEQMESRLAQANDEERLKILEELVIVYTEKDVQKALQYGKEALKLPGKFPDPKQEVTLLNRLSAVCIRMGNFKLAEEYAEKSLSIALKLGYKTGEADAWLKLGEAYKNYAEFTRAMNYLQKAYEIYQQTNNKQGMADYLNQMCKIHMRLGDFDLSLDYGLKSKKIYEELEDERGLARINKNIGSIYFQWQKWEQCLQYYTWALELYKRMNDQWGIAVIYNNMGVAYKQKGDYDKALEILNQSLPLCQNFGLKRIWHLCLGNIGDVYSARNNHSLALEYFAQSLQIAESINDQMGIAFVLLLMSRSLKEQGKYDEALQRLNRAYSISTRIDLKSITMDLAKDMADVYQVSGNLQKALEFYKKYEEIKNIIFNERTETKISQLQLKYDAEKNEKEIALLKKEKEIQNLTLEQQKNLRNLLLIITSLVLILAFVIYNRYRTKTKVNRSLAKETEEHKQTARKLRESEEKFRVLAEKSMVGIYIIQDNVIQYTNPHFLTIFGYSAEEIIGQVPGKLAVDQDRALVNQKISQALSGLDNTGDLGSHNYEFRGLRKTGEVIYLESYGAGTHYQGRAAVLETIIDITSRKHTETELLKSQKLESLGILAGGISHDFNNLLAVIVGNITMAIEEANGQQPITKMLDAAEKASNQSAELVKQLISLSRTRWIKPEKIKLTALLNETKTFYPELKSLQYTANIPPDLPPLYSDSRQLRQVLSSLLKNADEFTEEPKQITLEAKHTHINPGNIFFLPAGDYVKISVIDNGKGIPKDHLKNIFDPYFSTKDTFTQKGMGLGLAISYSIIKNHNGHIGIESEPGKGTRVEIYLPAFSDTPDVNEAN